MTILDRYIARQFLTNVVVLLVILFSFVVVIDASINLSRFANTASKLAADESGAEPGVVRKAIATLLVIADLWWPRLLQLFNFLIGLVLVAAMGFTCTQLSRHREFIAMLAAGISLQRVGRPILVVAVLVSVVQLANQEFVVPRIAPLLLRDHGEIGERSLSVTAIPLTADGANRRLRAHAFDPESGTLTGLYVMERDDAGRMTRRITADAATWNGRGWDLQNGYAVPLTPLSEGLSRTPTPVDFLESTLGPTELILKRFDKYRNALSFMQTTRLLQRRDLLDPRDADNYQRIRWGRFAMVAANLLTLFIAMPFFITREPANMVVQCLKASPITIAALMGGALGSAAGIPGLPAAVGVFIPVMILVTVALAARSFIKT